MTPAGTKESCSFARMTPRRRSLDCFLIARNLLAPLGLNVFERNPDQEVVDIIPAKVRIAIGRKDLEDTIVNSSGWICRTFHRPGHRPR